MRAGLAGRAHGSKPGSCKRHRTHSGPGADLPGLKVRAAVAHGVRAQGSAHHSQLSLAGGLSQAHAAGIPTPESNKVNSMESSPSPATFGGHADCRRPRRAARALGCESCLQTCFGRKAREVHGLLGRHQAGPRPAASFFRQKAGRCSWHRSSSPGT